MKEVYTVLGRDNRKYDYMKGQFVCNIDMNLVINTVSPIVFSGSCNILQIGEYVSRNAALKPLYVSFISSKGGWECIGVMERIEDL